MSGEIDPENIIAIHDSSSREYKKKCAANAMRLSLTAQSLEPSIAPAAHVAMFDFAAGKR